MFLQKSQSRRLVNIQIHPRQTTTVSKIISRTANITIRHGDILTLTERREKTLPVDVVTAPTFATILDTSVLIHPALLKTRIDRHGVTVAHDKLRQ
jgi:hypothetical protein